MIRRSRPYSRKEPDKDAIAFYIFCEGKEREPEYFRFFAGMDSKIKIELIPAEQHGSNTPDALYKKASQFFIKSGNNPDPKYELADFDKVWFVIDTDDWKDKIKSLRFDCEKHANWHIAQSNPSFEIWLYFHFYNEKPKKNEVDAEVSFKAYLNRKIKGGFDSKKDYIHLERAALNSELNFEQENNEPKLFSTNLHELAKQILPLIKNSLDKIISYNDIQNL